MKAFLIPGFVLVIALLCGNHLKAQLTFDANFENGRLDTSYVDDNSYVLWPVTNLHFRMTHALNASPSFKIYDSVGYQLRPYHQMVYRYEGDTMWHFFDTAYKSMNVDFYHFHNTLPFTSDTVYVAYWYPYTYSDLQDYLGKISGSPYVENIGAKGTTIEGRNLYGYQITDTNYSECYKPNVVVVARQHPIENINGYFVEGLTNYLLYATDTLASFLRKNHRFFIYPMLNPDGVFNGSAQNALGQGLNREWEDSLISGGTPEVDTMRKVIWQETGQQVDWFIDIHANPGSNIPYYWWGFISDDEVPQWQVDQALDYVQAVAGHDISSPDGTSSFQNSIQGNGVNTSKTAANWFRKTFNSIAFTFEPTSEPMGPAGNNSYSVDHLRAAGQSLAKGFYNVHDTAMALGGTIQHSGNLLIVEADGGIPPYTFEWTGALQGNSDTINATVPGLYHITVQDSLGCMWQGSVLVGTLSVGFNGYASFDLYPNPTSNRLTIGSEDFTNGMAVSLILYDLQGRALLKSAVMVNNHQAVFQIPPSVENGMYRLHIRSDGKDRVEKVNILR